MNGTITSNVIWSAVDAAAATGGQARGDWIATGVSIDTRTMRPGDLFVALRGDHGDGHDYVAKALELGAAAALVAKVPDGLSDKAPLLIVPGDDTLPALEALGRAARARSGAQVIGITGSVGKTGTKEMLLAALSGQGQAYASKASHNNHWGVPLSLAGMHGGIDYGIFEMGMNHPGEITPLSQMVRPDIAIITAIAAVHMEHFDSLDQIAAAKAEIFDGMAKGGRAVLPRDSDHFTFLRQRAETRGVTVFSFGEGAGADARMTDCLEAANGSRITADILGEEVSFTINIPGRHIAGNALAVLLAVKLAGGDLQKAARGLAGITAIAGRGAREFIDIGVKDNPVTLIDESYNASPEAMKAAFKVLALIDPGRGGRRIAVLGDMLELGRAGPKLHEELALPLKAAGVQLVYTCGPLMKNLYDALPEEKRGAHRKDSVELARIVPEVLTPGDVVMVKGSNGSKMGVVVEALRTMPERFGRKRKSTDNAL